MSHLHEKKSKTFCLIPTSLVNFFRDLGEPLGAVEVDRWYLGSITSKLATNARVQFSFKDDDYSPSLSSKL